MGGVLKGNIYFTTLAISAAIVSIMLLSFTPHYLTSDDPGVIDFIKSGFDVPPFMSIILGQILSFFYLHVNGHIPWYALLFYALHIINLAFFLRLALSLKDLTHCTVLLFLVVAMNYTQFVINLGLNPTALLTGAASLTIFILQSCTGDLDKKRAILLGIVFSFCYLIRKEALLGILIVFAPLLVICLTRAKTGFILNICLFSLPVALFAASNLYFTNFSTSPQYKSFLKYQDVIDLYHNGIYVRDGEATARMVKLNGWTENDLNLFNAWYWADENRYGVEKLMNIDKSLKKKYDIGRNGVGMEEWLRSAKECLAAYKLYIFMNLAVLAACCQNNPNKKILIWYVLYANMLFMGMYMFYRLPLRAGIPLYTICTTNILLLARMLGCGEGGGPGYRLQRYVNAIILSVAGICIAGNFYTAYGKDTIEVDKFNRSLALMNSNYAGDVIYVENGIFKWQNPFVDYPATYTTIKRGWITFSEPFYDSIHRLGIREPSRIFDRFAAGGNCFVLASDKLAPLLRQYVLESGSKVEFVKDRTLPMGSSLYYVRSNERMTDNSRNIVVD